MNRRAAGGAGRPVTPTRVWAVLLALLLGTLALLPGAPAEAAPDSGAPTTDPVQVTVSRLEPRTVTPGATIEVAVVLTNASDDTITDLSMRLQRGDRLTSRQALAEDVTTPSAGDAAQTPFEPVPGQLEPGDDLSFTYTTTAESLALGADGVYPVLVNVNGLRSGTVERVGELSTYLVSFGAGTTAKTSVAVLWPLTDRPHRDATGAFTDDDLATEISADGRLDRALDVLEDLPDGGRTVPVTLAVDPALVEELTVMAGGYSVAGETGQGTTAATDWLERLTSLAAVHTVAALPYADVDADALESAGLSAVLTRSLPGTPDGTAAQRTDGDPSSTPSAPPSTPADDETGSGAGADILAEALDTTPRTDLAWPAGGALRTDTLGTLQAGGVDELVLGESAYADPDAATGRTGRAAAARVPVDTADGEVTTLVADGALGEVLAGADTAVGGARIAEQRFLAELGVLTSQLAAVDPAVTQTVLVVPPRDVQSDPSWATAMLTDTATQPWLVAASVEDLTRGPVADAGELVEPAADAQLSGAGLAEVATTAAVRDDIAAAVEDDADRVLAGYDAAIARAVSVAWRSDPAGFAAAAGDLEQSLTSLRERVSLVVPADGTYSLAASDAPLVLTVRNELPFAVSVRLSLNTRSGVGFSADDVPVQRLEPDSLTTVTVPVSVRQSGSFTVDAELFTPSGGQLGTAVQLTVSSTAYGPITLAITVGAAVLLALLFLRRLVLFVLRRRRDGAGPAREEMPPLPDDAARPTRSRV